MAIEMTALVSCPPPGQRKIYERVYNRENVRYAWSCPVCPFTVVGELGESERSVQKQADEHECDAGWCAVPWRARA